MLAHNPNTYLALDYISYDEFEGCVEGTVKPAAADVVAQSKMVT